MQPTKAGEIQATGQGLLTLEDAARFLGGISVWFLRKAIARGTVQPTRLGRRVFLTSLECARIQAGGLPSLKAPVSK
jgi:hypothetical protein